MNQMSLIGERQEVSDREASTRMLVDIVIPVLNEELRLPLSLKTLASFLPRQASFDWNVIVADNGSTDQTPVIGRDFSRQDAQFQYFRIEERGRGRILKEVWGKSSADILVYMDVDLSTNLKFLSLLIEGIHVGYDIAIGSRLMQASRIKRSFKREIISQSYNLLVRSLFFNRFSDAQCGFKAIRRDVFFKFLPLLQDNHWFFDTELLLLAEKNGYRIFEIPVEWTEDMDSRVKVFKTAWEDIKGLIRLRTQRMQKPALQQTVSL